MLDGDLALWSFLLDMAIIPFTIFGVVLMGRISRLDEDHREIKQTLTKLSETQASEHNAVGKKIDGFQATVSEKVETIMRDHSSHEVGQARLETKIDWLLDKEKNK